MTTFLIVLSLSAVIVGWAALAWRLRAARDAEHRTAQAAQRAIFSGSRPDGVEDAASRLARRPRPQFGRR